MSTRVQTLAPGDTSAQIDLSGKRADMLQAAKLEFLENGFEATSMDKVAARVGITKRTLYAHFASKDALYQDIALYGAHLFQVCLPVPDAEAEDLAGELADFCTVVLANMAWDHAVAMQRMLIGSSAKFPDLAPTMYEASVGVAADRLAKCLSCAARAGRIAKPASARDAAHQLLLMTTGKLHNEILMGVRDPLPGPPGPETYKAIDKRAVRRAVGDFLKLLG